jgi:hypothetical protein
MRKKSVVLLVALSLCMAPLLSQTKLGADAAAPEVARFLDGLSLSASSAYRLSETETRALLEIAARRKLNVFELLDCAYRGVSARNGRIALSGSYLRNLESRFKLGDERIMSIFPVSILDYLETGSPMDGDDTALDIYLTKEHEDYVEIGTAHYQKKFGFAKIKPLEFSSAYGVVVQKLFLTMPLVKLELYAPGKGAIYVSGIARPKRWNLEYVKEKKQ